MFIHHFFMKDCIINVNHFFYVKDLSTLNVHDVSLSQEHINITIVYFNNKQLKRISNDVKKKRK